MKLHVVLTRVADRRYAVPSSHVVEVIPRVQARSLPQSPDWLQGWINYRGRLILAIDFSALLGREACPARMSNRILVVRTDQADTEECGLIGLLVEAVCSSESIEWGDGPAHAQVSPPEAEYLTSVMLNESEMIQLVEPAKLPKPFAEVED